MKTIYVKTADERHFHMHVQLSADQWFTLSIPRNRSKEVYEVPDIEAVHAKIVQEKSLVEVTKPAEFVKLDDKGMTNYVELEKDTKNRLETERAQRNAERLIAKEKEKADAAKPKKA